MIIVTQNNNTVYNKWKHIVLKAVMYMNIWVGSIMLSLVLLLTIFPDKMINSIFHDHITKALAEAYPAYSIKFGDIHVNFWKNRLEVNSATLKTIDTNYTCTASSLSISGINWIKLIGLSTHTYDILAKSIINLNHMAIIFHESKYKLTIGRLHLSVPDSELEADTIKYCLFIKDECFFAKSPYRQTMYSFEILGIKITNLDVPALLQGSAYKAKSISINNSYADILVNMDKQRDKNQPNPRMPNEAFASIKEIIKVESVKFSNGRLKYSERYAVKAKPAVITFNKVNLSVSGIANHSPLTDTVIINGGGIFMNSGEMKLEMTMPMTSTDFSLKYSGMLGPMDATKLNSFIEPAEHHRLKSGIVESANFNINVKSGHASGSLHVVYKDLSIAILNKKTGSEKGIFDRIASLFGKIFVIRGSNIPDENGLLKIGEIDYVKQPDNTFLQFLWISLRGGVADVAGFPKQ